ncbi:MAG: neocarzinostatin apoprotein domain-containing protein [Acidimicrobiales bacterium]
MRLYRAGALLALACLLAACSGGSSASNSSTTTTPTSSSPTSTVKAGQHLTITPATGLKSSQTVRLSASGFSPGEALVVTECANKVRATTEGDCNVGSLKSVTSNSSGDVSTTFTVLKGPFGTNHIVCSTPTACVVAVTQATPNPTQDATATVSFG